MAFIDFADAAQHALPASQDQQQAGALSQDLSELELRVVQLARVDGLDSLQPQRRRSRLGRLILGPPPPARSLANESLEAVRRLAVHAWHEGYQLPASALKAAREAGMTETKISAIVDAIGRSRPPVRRIAA